MFGVDLAAVDALVRLSDVVDRQSPFTSPRVHADAEPGVRHKRRPIDR